MNTSIRRATPDSEAIASSEDERPWPAAQSFGSFPHKEAGVPGLGVGIWSTQKRGSFKMEKTAQQNAAREARLGAPGQPRSGLRNDSTPSPSASEGSAALPFRIPLHPTPKAVRSLSHSQGQREYPLVTGAHSTQPEHAPALPLGLLAEEVDTESESELGGALTQTTSHPPIGTLHRTATFPATYDSYYGAANGRDHGEGGVGAQGGSKGDRRFEAAFANLTLASEQPQRRSQWQTHLGWDDVPNVNESRRHSLADIPTRRGSLVGGTEQRSLGGGQYWPDTHAYDYEEANNAYNDHQFRDSASHLEFANRAAGGTPDEDMLTRQFAALYRGDHLPKSYRVNPITLPENERNGAQDFNTADTMGPKNGQQFGGGNRARRQLYIVSFKCSRADVFYLLDNTGLHIRDGDIVIVEADRGQDLGTVQHSNVTQEEARHYLRRYKEEQYKWLMMFSKNNNKNSVNPNAQVYSGDRGGAAGSNNPAPASYAMGMRDNANLKPKAIKRLASQHEIRMLADKEGNEAKAKRTCQNKVTTLHLEMEILDAEWQWDFQKLIFYYYADHYINFKDLVTELYRIYKTRIWMGAINPASYSQHAISSPPDGIGPGALTGAARAAYYSSLAAGVDPDPYGAVPPYQVGYTTYNPNYPAIPGVVNSFANPMSMPFTPMANQGAETPQGNEATPYSSGNATPSSGMLGMNHMPYNAPNNMYGSGDGSMATGMPAPNSMQVPGANNMQLPSLSGPWPGYGGYGSYGGFANYGSYGSGQGFRPSNTVTPPRRPSDPIAIPPKPSRGRGGPTSSGDSWLHDPANFRTARPPGVRSGHYDITTGAHGPPTRLPPSSSGAAQQSSAQATSGGASQHTRLSALPELSGKAGLMNQFLDSLPPEKEDRPDLMRAASENW